jgi:hypothetical protein
VTLDRELAGNTVSQQLWSALPIDMRAKKPSFDRRLSSSAFVQWDNEQL